MPGQGLTGEDEGYGNGVLQQRAMRKSMPSLPRPVEVFASEVAAWFNSLSYGAGTLIYGTLPLLPEYTHERISRENSYPP